MTEEYNDNPWFFSEGKWRQHDMRWGWEKEGGWGEPTPAGYYKTANLRYGTGFIHIYRRHPKANACLPHYAVEILGGPLVFCPHVSDYVELMHRLGVSGERV